VFIQVDTAVLACGGGTCSGSLPSDFLSTELAQPISRAQTTAVGFLYWPTANCIGLPSRKYPHAARRIRNESSQQFLSLPLDSVTTGMAPSRPPTAGTRPGTGSNQSVASTVYTGAWSRSPCCQCRRVTLVPSSRLCARQAPNTDARVPLIAAPCAGWNISSIPIHSTLHASTATWR
jgi:hypothetical protein